MKQSNLWHFITHQFHWNSSDTHQMFAEATLIHGINLQLSQTATRSGPQPRASHTPMAVAVASSVSAFGTHRGALPSPGTGDKAHEQPLLGVCLAGKHRIENTSSIPDPSQKQCPPNTSHYMDTLCSLCKKEPLPPQSTEHSLNIPSQKWWMQMCNKAIFNWEVDGRRVIYFLSDLTTRDPQWQEYTALLTHLFHKNNAIRVLFQCSPFNTKSLQQARYFLALVTWD